MNHRLYVLNGAYYDPSRNLRTDFGYFDMTSPSNPVWVELVNGTDLNGTVTMESPTWTGSVGDIAEPSSYPGCVYWGSTVVDSFVTNTSDIRLWLYGMPEEIEPSFQFDFR
jgi:hypothetical protein